MGTLHWERLALTPGQVRQYGLPKITKKDKRHRLGGGEHEAVETEALSQSIIVEILKTRLDELLPEPLEDVLARAEVERGNLRHYLELIYE